VHHRIYVGPFEAVDVLGVTVARGEQLEVTAEEAAALDRQPGNWAKPTTTRGKQAAANPATPPATPSLIPPPVGEDDEQDDEQDDDDRGETRQDAEQQPAPTTAPIPAPGEGTDAEEAGQ